jgi:hypothetical protein
MVENFRLSPYILGRRTALDLVSMYRKSAQFGLNGHQLIGGIRRFELKPGASLFPVFAVCELEFLTPTV